MNVTASGPNLVASAATLVAFPPLIAAFIPLYAPLPVFSNATTGVATTSPAYGIMETKLKKPKNISPCLK